MKMMKRLLKKSVIMLLISGLLLLNCITDTALAGAAGGQTYDIGNLDLSKATVKPTLTISRHTIDLSSAAGATVTVTLSVGGADKKYAPTGIHISYDSRLSLIPNGYNELATKGPAGSSLGAEIQPDGSHGIFMATDASGNMGKDGVLWSFDFKIPTDVKAGDTFPVEIVYQSKPSAEDLFTNTEKDEVGQLMQAWVFTQGITQGYIEIKDSIAATVNGYSGNYDGQPHGIAVQVTNPASGATVKYKNKDGQYTLTECPTITNVADSPMTVEYQITASGYNPKTGSATVTLSPIDPTAPQNLTADYGQKLSDVTLPEGWSWADDSLSVGDVGENTFKANYTSASANYNSVNNVDVTVSVNAVPAELTVVPSANSLVYNGNDQALITEGEAEGGKVVYAPGTKTEPTDDFSETIPTGKNAGTYYVWYKVKADDNHEDTEMNYVEASIAKRSVTLTSATASKVYDGKALKNDKVTVSGDGWAKGEGATYKVTGSQTKVGKSKNAFTYTLKSGTDAKNYTVVTKTGTLTVTKAPVVKPSENGTFIHITSVTQKDNKIQVNWTKVNQAEGYDVYVQYCTKGFAEPVKTVKKSATTQTTIAKLNGKKIDQTKAFKTYVVAYKMVNGKKTVLAKTVTSHVAGLKNAQYTNQKTLTLAKSTFEVKVGKTAKIKVSATLASSKKILLPEDHSAAYRFKSSDTRAATVDKNGKITAKKKGACYIFVYGISGLMKKVKVTVK